MANIVEIILKATDQASKAFKSAEGSAGKFEAGLKKLVAKLGVTALAGAALKKGLDFAVESTILAARVETLGAVTEIMGRNAGVSAQEIDKLEKSIQAQGITTQASRQALAQMMQAEIDLTKATDLARLAQDAAVVGNTNSSEAFQRLTQVIGTGNTEMARTMGLLVDFEGAYKTLADSLGKPVTELTELEKVQARTNEVMAQGRTIAGAYTAAMETGGKKAQSYARHLEELKLAVGDTFVDAFSAGVDVVTEGTDTLTSFFRADKLLNDEVKRGNMAWTERLMIRAKVILTEKEAQDVVEELTEEEEKRNAAIEQANKIFEQAETYEAYKERMLDLAFATRELNVDLGMLSETQWFVTKEVADADAAMLSYANSIGMVIVPTIKLTDSTQRYTDASNKFSDRAREGAAAMRELAAGAGEASSRLDGVSTGLYNTINAQKELIKWIAGGGGILNDMADQVMEMYDQGLIDGDTALAALDEVQIGVVDLEEELGMITTEEAVEKLTEMGIPVDEAKAKVAELQEQLFRLTSLPYRIDVIVNDGTGGTGGGGGPKPGPARTKPTNTGGGGTIATPFGFAGASGLDFTVPPGYPNDSFGPIWAQSGEDVKITPRGQSGSGRPIIYQQTYHVIIETAEAARAWDAARMAREAKDLRDNL